MAKARRSFTKEYKAEVVKLIWTSGMNPGALARELGLTETSVRVWMKRAAIDEKRDPLGPLTSEERAENTRLRRELLCLRREVNDVAKHGDLALTGRGDESPGRIESFALVPPAHRQNCLRPARAPAHAAGRRATCTPPQLRRCRS